MSKRGRPSKLTPQFREEFVNLIKYGNYVETACAMMGIDRSTYYYWMKKGENSKRATKYRKFYLEVEHAKAWSEARDLAILKKHAETNWRAMAWYLERRYPGHWGEKVVRIPVTSDIDCVKYENEDNAIFFGNIRTKKGNNSESRVLETDFIYRKYRDDDKKDELTLINPYGIEKINI